MSGRRSSRAQPRTPPKRNRERGYLGHTYGGQIGPGWPTLADGTQILPGQAITVRLSDAEPVGTTVGQPYWSEDRGWLVHVEFPGTLPVVECHLSRLEWVR